MTPGSRRDGRARAIGRDEAISAMSDLRAMEPEQRRALLRKMAQPALRALLDEWAWQAGDGQIDPGIAPGGEPWRTWALVAGRGYGKTRAGAEWIWARVREAKAFGTVTSDCPLRIALVGASMDEVARVMVEGESGLLATARCDEAPRWLRSRGLLIFPGGAEAHAFSAERPDKLRGPQHHFAWCDELAKWPPSTGSGQSKADSTWVNLMMGLRLGERPRTIVTTTPRPVPALKRVLALPRTARTHGRTDENPDNAADFRAGIYETYGGTRLGRQELEGELLEEHEGALWTRELIERGRVNGDSHFSRRGGELGAAARESDCPLRESDCPLLVVIAVDPPASTGGDSCGILVCGKDADGIVYVLADLTARGLTPEAWARRVADAAALWGASRVVAEKNIGGDMIASVLRAVDADLPVRLVPATRSKAARAEPIALRFETGRARLAGHFPELEDQLCALTYAGYQGAGSPDRADAMVWAMTALFEKERAIPRVTRL